MVFIGILIIGFLFWFVSAVFGALFLMWGWNLSIPEIFQLPEIGFWTAFGLSLTAHALLRPIINIDNHKSN